jgi:hypothetical protein
MTTIAGALPASRRRGTARDVQKMGLSSGRTAPASKGRFAISAAVPMGPIRSGTAWPAVNVDQHAVF